MGFGERNLGRKPAKRDSSVLHKLARACIGGSQQVHFDALKTDMVSFARNMHEGDAKRSHEGVRNWFKQPFGIPVKSENYLFVKVYAEEKKRELPSEDISNDERRKRSEIFSKVIQDCKNEISEKSDDPNEKAVRYSNDVVSIDQSKIHHANRDDLVDNCPGIYEIYRQPVSEKGEIVTREVIEVTSEASIIKVKWHYRFNETDILSFVGNFVISGDAVYFFLYNHKYKGRMRIFVSETEFWSHRRDEQTLGILLTQMPFRRDKTMFGLSSRKVLVVRKNCKSIEEIDINNCVRRISQKEIDDSEFLQSAFSKIFSENAHGLDI